MLVEWPPVGASLHAGFLQLGFPYNTPVSLPGAIESWVDIVTSVSLPQIATNRSLREPLWGPLPAGSFTFSIQFVSFLATPAVGPSCGANLTMAASPALAVTY